MTRSLRERHGKFVRDLEQGRTKHVSTAKHDNKSTDIITSYIPLLDKGFGTPIIVTRFIQPAFAEKYY